MSGQLHHLSIVSRRRGELPAVERSLIDFEHQEGPSDAVGCEVLRNRQIGRFAA
jgi:hypothetical protein